MKCITRCKVQPCITTEAFSETGSKPVHRIQPENARLEAVLWILIILDTSTDSVRAPQCFHILDCMWKMQLQIGKMLVLQGGVQLGASSSVML